MRREIPNQELLDTLHSGAEALKLEWEDLLRRGAERRQEWEGHMSAIRLIKAVLEAGEAAEGAAAPADAADLAVELSNLDIDFAGARNHAERVRRIGAAAKANGRLLNTTIVTRLMVDRGEIQSNVKNMRPTIHRILEDHPDLYAKVGAGTFDYIYVEADPEPDQYSQVEQPSPTGPGEASLGGTPCLEGNLISIESCEEEDEAE